MIVQFPPAGIHFLLLPVAMPYPAHRLVDSCDDGSDLKIASLKP
jgi:hypothetical protein